MIKKIISIIVPIILVITFLLIFSCGGTFKAKYEISKKILESVKQSNYVGNDSTCSGNSALCDGDLGIKCGSNVKLGTYVSLDSFTIVDKISQNNLDILHVLSPSKQYELIVYKEIEDDVDNLTVLDQPLWYVWGIRSTNPNVSTTRDIMIGSSKKTIKNNTGLSFTGSKGYMNINGCEVYYQFDSSLLTEVYMHV